MHLFVVEFRSLSLAWSTVVVDFVSICNARVDDNSNSNNTSDNDNNNNDLSNQIRRAIEMK